MSISKKHLDGGCKRRVYHEKITFWHFLDIFREKSEKKALKALF